MRLLVIEDDPEIGRFLKGNLESHAFSVDLETDGVRGSYLARTNEYDLIVLDYGLPGKDGEVICAELRSAGRHMPIIMLTVQVAVDRKIELLNAGADDYVTKPFSFGELLARIHALLRRPRAVQHDRLEVGDLVIDVQKQLVTRDGKEVYLTRKEFQLLEYMARNVGNVVSRGQILEHVWDAEADPFSNTIETHVLNLRRKIDREAGAKLIHTIPGRGYKLDIRK